LHQIGDDRHNFVRAINRRIGLEINSRQMGSEAAIPELVFLSR